MEEDSIGKLIVDSAFKVHTAMGPGLLESIYQSCMVRELLSRGIKVIPQHQVPLVYQGETLSDRLVIDLLVEDKIIVELKAVEALLPVHQAQLISYMKLSNVRLGFLINFNVPMIKSGIKRFVL